MAVLPGLRLPVIGTTLNMMGPRGFSALKPSLLVAHPRLLNLEFHAIDFVDRHDSSLLNTLAAHQPDLRTSVSRKIRTARSVFEELSRAGAFRPLESALDLL
jgi:hypothetical protein